MTKRRMTDLTFRQEIIRALDLIKIGDVSYYHVNEASGIRNEVLKKYNEDRKKLDTMPLLTAEKLSMFYWGHRTYNQFGLEELEGNALKNALLNVSAETMHDYSDEIMGPRGAAIGNLRYEKLMLEREKPETKELYDYAQEKEIVFDAAGNIVFYTK